MSASATPVGDLENIGPTVKQRLASIGIRTRGDLTKMGPAQAYRRLRRQHPSQTLPVCYYLYSLEAALRGVHWDELTAEEKKNLRSQADAR